MSLIAWHASSALNGLVDGAWLSSNSINIVLDSSNETCRRQQVERASSSWEERRCCILGLGVLII